MSLISDSEKTLSNADRIYFRSAETAARTVSYVNKWQYVRKCLVGGVNGCISSHYEAQESAPAWGDVLQGIDTHGRESSVVLSCAEWLAGCFGQMNRWKQMLPFSFLPRRFTERRRSLNFPLTACWWSSWKHLFFPQFPGLFFCSSRRPLSI